MGIFPSRLKFLIVKPIYKTGDKLNIANFRPSLLTSFLKVFEKIIYSRMYQHVVQNQILAKEQYGFRSKSSTDKAPYTLIHEILTAFNNKQIVVGIFCDLRKAFDVVNHKIMLNKLEQYGIVRKFNALIKSYLTERYERVIIQNNSTNSYSDLEIVKHGVPQGSILGPLFFLLFINNLPLVTSKNTTLVLYADDTSLIITGLILYNSRLK
jgi:hypothetical protein